MKRFAHGLAKTNGRARQRELFGPSRGAFANCSGKNDSLKIICRNATVPANPAPRNVYGCLFCCVVGVTKTMMAWTKAVLLRRYCRLSSVQRRVKNKKSGSPEKIASRSMRSRRRSASPPFFFSVEKMHSMTQHCASYAK